ncbi:MAG: PKD domain-containing protein, partial [Halobacteriales archaeon]|nr:PKD domain-containing protein [Halobacteriales archaeon]
ALLTVTLALAGCATDDGASSTTSKATSSGTGKVTSTGSPPAATGTQHPNAAPAATLTARNTRGPAPLNVTFVANATDADRDPLTYSLAFGDGSAPLTGSAFPLNVTHPYTQAGNFTVRLTVRDGAHQVNVTVLVQASNATAAGPAGFVPVTLSGTAALPCEPCVAVGLGELPVEGCASWLAQESGGDCVFFPLPASAVGQPWSAKSVGTAGDNDVAVMFYDACDAAASRLAWIDNGGGDESGEVPTGAACVALYENLDVQSALSIAVG